MLQLAYLPDDCRENQDQYVPNFQSPPSIHRRQLKACHPETLSLTAACLLGTEDILCTAQHVSDVFVCWWVTGSPAPPGQGWGCEGGDSLISWLPKPGGLASPPPELICSKENKEFHHIQTITCLYLQLTFLLCAPYMPGPTLCLFYVYLWCGTWFSHKA